MVWVVSSVIFYNIEILPKFPLDSNASKRLQNFFYQILAAPEMSDSGPGLFATILSNFFKTFFGMFTMTTCFNYNHWTRKLKTLPGFMSIKQGWKQGLFELGTNHFSWLNLKQKLGNNLLRGWRLLLQEKKYSFSISNIPLTTTEV